MINKSIFSLIIIFLISSVFAESLLHTPQIVTVSSGKSISPVSFFNDGPSRQFNAAFISDTGFAHLQEYSIYVEEQSYGSFSLVIGDPKIEPGFYSGRIIISDESGILFNIPVFHGQESPNPKKFDTSIDFNEAIDTNFLSNELIISPNIRFYKLNFNPSTTNNVVVELNIYDMYGKIIDSSENTLSVSTQSSFEHFSNLGVNPPRDIVIVATVKSSGQSWMDISQVSLPDSPVLLSPFIEKKDYSTFIYLGVFIFLIASMIVLSYFWNHRVLNQANDWRSRVNYIKKIQFSDSAKAMRKLKYQKDVLQRAYDSHYITKESYKTGMIAIENLSSRLKKRL